jgi:uncharacterized membrane protein
VDKNFKKMMYILIGVFAVLVVIGIITIWQGPISSEILIKESDINLI